MTATQWTIGERIYDDDYRMFGVVIGFQEYYHSDAVVITVRFDNGDVFTFTPDDGTRKVSPCTTTT